MKWTPELHEKMIRLMTERTRDFKNLEYDSLGPFKGLTEFHVTEWWKHLESMGIVLVEEIFPKVPDVSDSLVGSHRVRKYKRICNSHMRKISKKTGMFPCFMPDRTTREKHPFLDGGKRFKGILIPMELAEKILLIGGVP